MRVDPTKIPSTLRGQLARQLPAYLAGAVVLAIFQVSMNRIDWLSKQAIDLIFGPDPSRAWRPASIIFGLAVVAFVTRVASRWFMFNAGRDVEYEVRTTLLTRLHRLGAAFYRTMSAGEIMSRSTNDLAQVRMLYGFGVLNIINVAFAFASAPCRAATISNDSPSLSRRFASPPRFRMAVKRHGSSLRRATHNAL